jgi:hypothetical protein
MAYVHVPYPAWRFHFSEPMQQVDSAEADAALGPDWVASPAFVVAPAPEPPPVVEVPRVVRAAKAAK